MKYSYARIIMVGGARVSTHMHVSMCIAYAKGIEESECTEGHCYVGIFLHSLYIAVLPMDNSSNIHLRDLIQYLAYEILEHTILGRSLILRRIVGLCGDLLPKRTVSLLPTS